MHCRDTLNTKHYKDLTENNKKSILESQMFIKGKRDGKIKGRTAAGGKKQRDFISKEYSSFPTVANVTLLQSCIIDA